MEFIHQLLSIPEVFRWLPTRTDISDIRPSERNNEASDNAVLSRGCDQLAIFPSRRRSSGEVRSMAGLRLGVCIDQVVTRGTRCGSASSSAAQICKQSYLMTLLTVYGPGRL